MIASASSLFLSACTCPCTSFSMPLSMLWACLGLDLLLARKNSQFFTYIMSCPGIVSYKVFFSYLVNHNVEDKVKGDALVWEIISSACKASGNGLLLSLLEQILFVSLFSFILSLAPVRECIIFTIWDSGKMTAGLSEE